MSSQTEEIKNRVDIVGLVGSYVKLEKAGANFRALCPFHNEKTPSFNVSPARQFWHCFGCGKGGDIFTFVQEIDGVEFGDALKSLAERAGVELKFEDPRFRTERQRLYALLEEATKFFEMCLGNERGTSSGGAEPYNYLTSRCLADETIKAFRIGYAPNEWRALSQHLLSKGFKVDEMERAGLVVRNQSANYKLSTTNYYDRFRGRIMFPIFDYNGKAVAFGGRILETPMPVASDVGAKYINSPETVLYQKSKILYGLHKSKSEILRSGECVLVEGYMDMIMSYQAGIKNVVASSGTALTLDQLKILKRLGENLIAAFDMDSAGVGAAKRGIDLALAEGFDVKVVKLVGIKDPADAVAKDAFLWQNSVKNARHIAQFYIDSVLEKYSKDSPEAKKEFQRQVLPVVASLSELEQAHWIRNASEILDIKEEAVWEALKNYRPKIKNQLQRADINVRGELVEKLEIKTRKNLLEERIIGILAKYPSLAEKLDPALAGILPKENRAAFFAELFLNDAVEAEVEFMSCQKELQKENLRARLGQISHDIARAEKEGNNDISTLLSEFKKIVKELSLYG